MGFPKKALILAFLAWISVRVIVINKIFRTLGYGAPIFNHTPGPCRLFHVNGSEDIDVLPSGFAIFSSGLIYDKGPFGSDLAMKHYKGMLYSFDFNNPDKKPRPLSYENFNGELSPHGIDFFTDPETGEVRLFVINHAAGNHTVEIFTFEEKNMVLRHRKTIQDEKIYCPNDLVAVGLESFYTTNICYFNNIILAQVETFYPLKLGTIAFHDGKQSKFVAGNLNLPNGINVDSSGYIFVASVLDGDVIVFEREDNNDLVQRQRIKIGVALDNLNFDENGHLWLAMVHFGFFEYLSNFNKPFPGAAIQVKLSKTENNLFPFNVDDIREVYASDGKGEMKGASTALYHHGKLLIGSPLSNIVYCEVKEY